jgi:proteasome lid subunit RPN8/RPN11
LNLSTIISWIIPTLGDCERVWLISRRGIQELPNLAEDPRNNFRIDVEKLEEPEILATLHNHPSGNLNLSVNDYYAFQNYPHLLHFIVNKEGQYRAYRVQEGYVLNADQADISRLLEAHLP